MYMYMYSYKDISLNQGLPYYILYKKSKKLTDKNIVCPAHQDLPVGFLFCSGIQFYLLLIPYLCFISFLYLDLYVLGDDALIC